MMDVNHGTVSIVVATGHMSGNLNMLAQHGSVSVITNEQDINVIREDNISMLSTDNNLSVIRQDDNLNETLSVIGQEQTINMIGPDERLEVIGPDNRINVIGTDEQMNVIDENGMTILGGAEEGRLSMMTSSEGIANISAEGTISINMSAMQREGELQGGEGLSVMVQSDDCEQNNATLTSIIDGDKNRTTTLNAGEMVQVYLTDDPSSMSLMKDDRTTFCVRPVNIMLCCIINLLFHIKLG